MRTALASVVALTLCVGVAQADTITPEDVMFDYGEVAQSLTGTPGDAANGIKVMTNRGLGNCIACHQVTALEEYPYHGEVGPSLDGAGDRWTPEQLRGIVANAKEMFPDSIMPSFYKRSGYIRVGDAFTGKAPANESDSTTLLTAQEIEDVVAFLVTLKD